MAYSFYGGKEGISFLIKETYTSIQNMLDCFSQGMLYNTVGYGEFVIINAPNKADFENGAVYRRGFDYGEIGVLRPDKQAIEAKIVYDKDDPTLHTTAPYADARKYWDDRYHLITVSGQVVVDTTVPRTTVEFLKDNFYTDVYNYLKNPGAGAKYIGNLAGPEGAAAALELITWKNASVEIDFERAFNSGEADVGEQGKTTLSRSDGKTTDVASAGYCTIRDEYGNVVHSYVSFDLPKDAFEIQAESANPYGPTIVEISGSVLPISGAPDVYYQINGSVAPVSYLYENGEWIKREPWTATYNPETHQWEYTGLIREKQESEDHPYYHSYDIKIPKGIHGQDIDNLGIQINSIARVAGHDVDTSNHNYEMFYTKTNYDEAIPKTSIIYTGSKFKTIDSIETNEDTATYPVRVNHLKYVEGQRLRVEGQPDILLLCSKGGWTADAAPQEFNQLNINSVGCQFQDEEVIWTVIKKESVPFNIMRVYYTDGTHQDVDTRLLDAIEADDDGRVYAKYTDLDHRSYVTTNKQILGIDDNNNLDLAKLKVKYNTYKRDIQTGEIIKDDTFKYYNGSTIPISTTTPIAGITPDVYPTTDSEGREIQYLTDASLNDITDMFITGECLFVLYSDPERRKHLTNPYPHEYNGIMYDYENLGHIMEGSYVFGQFDNIDNLKTLYPYGLGKTPQGVIIPEEEKYIGWLVSIKDVSSGIGTMYHYDYYHANKPEYINRPQDLWREVDTFTSTKPNEVVLISQANGSFLPIATDKLDSGGIWFVVTP